jgi:hypothetical protein
MNSSNEDVIDESMNDPSATYSYPLPDGFDITFHKDPNRECSFEGTKELIKHYFYTDEPIQASETFALLCNFFTSS